MRARTMITMSQKEVGRLRILEQVLRGTLGQTAAAAMLQISPRQLRRVQRRYEAEGEQALHTACGVAPRTANSTQAWLCRLNN